MARAPKDDRPARPKKSSTSKQPGETVAAAPSVADQREARRAARQAEREARQFAARAEREARRQARKAAREGAVGDVRRKGDVAPGSDAVIKGGAAQTAAREEPARNVTRDAGAAKPSGRAMASKPAKTAKSAPKAGSTGKSTPRAPSGAEPTATRMAKAPPAPAMKADLARKAKADTGQAPESASASRAKGKPAPARKTPTPPAAPKAPERKKRGEARTIAPCFNILAVAQHGRLEAETALLAASLRRASPGWQGRLIVAEPRPEGAWDGHRTLISPAGREALGALGAEIVPFTANAFGAAYPQGNKIEALSLLPPGEPFLFLDSDTLVTGALDKLPLDFARPAASMRREGTWPVPPLYGPGYAAIWRTLYDRFEVPFDDTLDLTQPEEHWERFLYFSACWFLGADPAAFHARYLKWAREVWADPGEALATQKLDPWLDQVILPLVVRALGGGRPGAGLAPLDDGGALWHYRTLPLLYATAPEAVVDALEAAAAEPALAALMEAWGQSRRMILEGEGRARVRPLFDRDHLPLREQAIRQRLRNEGLWIA